MTEVALTGRARLWTKWFELEQKNFEEGMSKTGNRPGERVERSCDLRSEG